MISRYLENIRPFIEGSQFSRFFDELKKVPTYKTVFDCLVAADPVWLDEVKRSGFAYFFLEKVSKTTVIPNRLDLRHFECGKSPTIKVTTYRLK